MTGAKTRLASAIQTKGLDNHRFIDEAVDGGLGIDNRAEDAAAEARLVSLAKKASTALSQEADVGVKWKVQRGCLAIRPIKNDTNIRACGLLNSVQM